MEDINRLLLQFHGGEDDEAVPLEDANGSRGRVPISVAHATAASGRRIEG